MTLKIGKFFGIYLERMTGSDGKWYLHAVVWMPRDRRHLRYFYPSIRWF